MNAACGILSNTRLTIAPDVEVELDEDVEGIGLDFIDVDNQLQKAIEVLREKL